MHLLYNAPLHEMLCIRMSAERRLINATNSLITLMRRAEVLAPLCPHPSDTDEGLFLDVTSSIMHGTITYVHVACYPLRLL